MTSMPEMREMNEAQKHGRECEQEESWFVGAGKLSELRGQHHALQRKCNSEYANARKDVLYAKWKWLSQMTALHVRPNVAGNLTAAVCGKRPARKNERSLPRRPIEARRCGSG
jgi:hypothetical protein